MESRVRRYEPVSVEEYLRLEETSDVRHEYIDGHLYAMVGVTERHDDIVINLFLALGPAARRRQCRVNSGELLLQVSQTRYYYPDVAVYCGAVGGAARFRSEPCAVVEVLSPSTSATDRREKLFAYLGIERLETYLVVHQDERRVERHWRDAERVWRQEELFGSGDVPITCLGMNLSLDAIYEAITWDSE